MIKGTGYFIIIKTDNEFYSLTWGRRLNKKVNNNDLKLKSVEKAIWKNMEKNLLSQIFLSKLPS